MIRPGHEERRLHGTETASAKSLNGDPPILPGADDLVRGVFVLVVEVPTESEPRHRRRVFLQAQPAQRAADRAVERGHRADVVLCRLEPVETPGGWSE